MLSEKSFLPNETFSGQPNQSPPPNTFNVRIIRRHSLHDFNGNYKALDISVIVSNKLMILEAPRADIAFRPVVSAE